MCFADGEPICSRFTKTEKSHGRLTTRRVRCSQLLHGYSTFPGLRQVIEVTRTVKHLRGEKVVRTTVEIEYAITSLSPREGNARTLLSLMRRHWHIENKSHHIRDDGWREDRRTWRSGNAYSMHVLLSIALNLLRAPSRHWLDATSMTERSEQLDYLLTAQPCAVLMRGS